MPTTDLKVLLVEDSEADAELIVIALREQGYGPQTQRVETAEELRATLSEAKWDLVLFDCELPGFDAMEALQILISTGIEIPFIAISKLLVEENAVALLRAGAHDFICKDRLARLAHSIQENLDDAKTRQESKKLDQQRQDLDRCLRQVIGMVKEGVIIMDAVGLISFWNTAAENLFGYRSKEVIGRSLHDCVIPERHRKAFAEEFIQSVAPGKHQAINTKTGIEACNAAGDEFPVEISISPIQINGEWHALGIARDIHLEIQAREQRTLMEHEIASRKRIQETLFQETKEQKRLLQELKTTQSQLLQSEKMASIGQLAAGVAHEINNPVGFVNSNLGTLKTYLGELMELIDKYSDAEKELPEGSFLAKEIASYREKLDLDYLRQDISDLLHESLDGIDRVKKIVQDLKDFSHVDNKERQWSDLHHGLDSTLNVVWNELKYKAEVKKDYGEIPQVNCVASQLNQVFMNLLVNAGQAIETRGEITICTRHRDDMVEISIADTGSGIPEDKIDHIFEPFFTTKPVGKGTGLGLSLSYGVVQKHGGTLEVESEAGRGTRFILTIPVDGKDDKPLEASA